jgi:hypothetical protein
MRGFLRGRPTLWASHRLLRADGRPRSVETCRELTTAQPGSPEHNLLFTIGRQRRQLRRLCRTSAGRAGWRRESVCHEHVSPTEQEGTAPQARMSGSADTIRINVPHSPAHRVSALSERTLEVPSRSCRARQRAFSSGACNAIHVTPAHDDTCHWPCMSSRATSRLPSPASDMTAGMHRPGTWPCAPIGAARAQRSRRITRITRRAFQPRCDTRWRPLYLTAAAAWAMPSRGCSVSCPSGLAVEHQGWLSGPPRWSRRIQLSSGISYQTSKKIMVAF